MEESLRRLKSWVEAEEFRGYDPYDALNSPLLRLLSLGLKYPRIAVTQALRRLPCNIRPWIGIKKEHNPKGLGLLLAGYTRLYALEGGPRHLREIETLMRLLAGCRSGGYAGNCWGYNFPWQSRAFYLPRGTPTVVNTAFIGHALVDAWQTAGREQALKLALPIRDFILRDLNRTGDDEAFCFSYTPFDRTVIHNANLLGASLLARLCGIEEHEESRAAAGAALRWSAQRQRPDGSWMHAETNYQQWIDSFHTGFNLQSLLYFLQEGYWPDGRDAFVRGIDFYRDRFFLDDGTPKYYHDRPWPVDIHCPAQGIVLFSMVGGAYLETAERIASWMIANLQDQEGYFYFRKTPRRTNRIPYMRWGQAWAFRGLTEYLSAVATAGGEATISP